VAQHEGNRVAHDHGNYVAQHLGNRVAQDGGNSTRSLTSENKKELLRQKYIVEVGPITKDEFTGFMMTDEFAAFRRGQFQAQKSA
jgi:hypothetical protein